MWKPCNNHQWITISRRDVMCNKCNVKAKRSSSFYGEPTPYLCPECGGETNRCLKKPAKCTICIINGVERDSAVLSRNVS